MADHDRALGLDPNNSSVHTERGHTNRDKGEDVQAIADYSAAIRLRPTDVMALYNRARAYQRLSDYARAVADFTELIRLEPKDPQLPLYRGHVYEETGDLERAMADYSGAILVDPRWHEPYRSRGIGHYVLGDFATAAEDIARFAATTSDEAILLLWLYLARVRSGWDAVAAAGQLQEQIQLPAPQWPYPLVELLLGRRTPEDTLAAAQSPAEQGAAHFYIGSWHLLRGDHAAAIAAFKMAADTCPREFIEYAGARAELKRLGHQVEPPG